MDNKQAFKKYYSRLSFEGIVKALVLSAAAAVVLAFFVALASFFLHFNALWVVIPTIVVVISVLTPILYFRWFKPDTKAIARRIDRLGLEERVITMLELEKDQSFMAMRQREDTKAKLSQFNEDRLGFKFLKVPFVVLVVMLVLSAVMTGLSVVNAGESPIWGESSREPNVVAVTYLAGEGGMIYGHSDQIVTFGGDADMVVAVETNEWSMFDRWDDGVLTPERMDLNVREPITVTALFISLIEGSEELYGGDPNKPSDNENPNPGTVPPDPEDESEDEIDPKPPEGNPGNGEGSKEGQTPNMINANNDWYGDTIQNEINRVQDEVANDKDMPDYLREMIDDYYKYINVGDQTPPSTGDGDGVSD